MEYAEGRCKRYDRWLPDLAVKFRALVWLAEMPEGRLLPQPLELAALAPANNERRNVATDVVCMLFEVSKKCWCESKLVGGFSYFIFVRRAPRHIPMRKTCPGLFLSPNDFRSTSPYLNFPQAPWRWACL